MGMDKKHELGEKLKLAAKNMDSELDVIYLGLSNDCFIVTGVRNGFGHSLQVKKELLEDPLGCKSIIVELLYSIDAHSKGLK